MGWSHEFHYFNFLFMDVVDSSRIHVISIMFALQYDKLGSPFRNYIYVVFGNNVSVGTGF